MARNFQSFQVVEPFDYTNVDLSQETGDEFYEVRMFDETGQDITPSVEETQTYNLWEHAISDAKYAQERHKHPIVAVTVHGEQYPDGTNVPDGAIVWSSIANTSLNWLLTFLSPSTG